MTQQEAGKIAGLLSLRNQLAVEYTAKRALTEADNYLFESVDGTIVACLEVKKVQWYQWEICHLSVSDRYLRQGRGRRLVRLAEEKAKEGRARIVQCTIRAGNRASEEIFRRSGFREAVSFFNAETNNCVAVWQKVLCTLDA